MKPSLRRTVRHTRKAKKHESRMDYHIALARLHLAIFEEKEIAEFKEMLAEFDPTIECYLEGESE